MEALQFNPNGVPSTAGLSPTPAGPQGSQGPDFTGAFKKYLGEVNSLQLEADKAVRDLAAGKLDNVHEVIVAVNEADLSFRLMMQIRNKLVEAYKEIMRMQV